MFQDFCDFSKYLREKKFAHFIHSFVQISLVKKMPEISHSNPQVGQIVVQSEI